MTANGSGDDNISFPKILTSQIEERLVRDDFTNELYMTLSSRIVLKRKKEMLHVPLDFRNGLTVDALVDSGAYVSAKVQKQLDIIKQQAPANVFKINDPPNFQIQAGNGQLKKPIGIATHKFEEHFVVMKNLTGPIIGLHFKRHKSVVIDTAHELIHFPHLTMYSRSVQSGISAKSEVVFFHDSITLPPVTSKTITEFVDYSSEWHTTGTATPVGEFTKAASLIKSCSILTIFDKKIAVTVTNKTESPFSVNKNTQIADFSVVFPEQSMFIKPVDTEIVSMFPKDEPDLATYFTNLLNTNKS